MFANPADFLRMENWQERQRNSEVDHREAAKLRRGLLTEMTEENAAACCRLLADRLSHTETHGTVALDDVIGLILSAHQASLADQAMEAVR